MHHVHDGDFEPAAHVHVDERAVFHGIVPSCTVRRGRTGVVHCGFHSRGTDRAVIARPRVADALRFAAQGRSHVVAATPGRCNPRVVVKLITDVVDCMVPSWPSEVCTAAQQEC